MASDLRLSKRHHRLLVARSLSDDVIRARGYKTLRETPDLVRHGYSPKKTVVLPALLIPCYDVNGEPWGCQIRPDHPANVQGKKDKFVKYESPPGQTPLLDVSPYAADKVRDRAEPLFLTEGPIKADALAGAGYAGVAILGVSCWTTVAWSALRLSGREVYFAFDSDYATKPDVAVELEKCRKVLAVEYGAKVFTLKIPGDGNDKQGIDDYLASGALLDSLIEEADAGIQPAYDATSIPDLRKRLLLDLGRGPLVGVYRQDGDVIDVPEIGTKGYVKRCHHGINAACECYDGPAQRHVLDLAGLQNFLADRAKFYRVKKNADGSKERIDVVAPDKVCQMIIAGAYRNMDLPMARRVVHTPVVLPNGQFLWQPGHNPDYDILYLPLPGMEHMEEVERKPSKYAMEKAHKILDEGLKDFPWVSGQDRVNFLGAMLIPLLGPANREAFPMCIINAPQAGSGKTALGNILVQTFGGALRSNISMEPEEVRKSIASVLATTTGGICVFDNVVPGHPVGKDGSLSALLTSGNLSDRQLGKTKELALRNDRLWVATGNNLKLAEDMPRRCFWVNIDPGRPKPEERKFDVDILRWAKDNRASIIWALLTYIRKYQDTRVGYKKFQWRTDTYGRLGAAVRGILMVAGEERRSGGFQFWGEPAIEAEKEVVWMQWLEALSELYGEREFSAKDVEDALLAEPGGRLWDAAPGYIIDGVHRGIGSGARSIGHSFTNRINHWVGDLRVVPVNTNRNNGRALTYLVERAEPTTER